jgi:hypothetical protein
VVLKRDWQRDQRAILNLVVTASASDAVKPANFGSASASRRPSTRRAAHGDRLRRRIRSQIVIEAAVRRARSSAPAAATRRRCGAGRDHPSREFYDYGPVKMTMISR